MLNELSVTGFQFKKKLSFIVRLRYCSVQIYVCWLKVCTLGSKKIWYFKMVFHWSCFKAKLNWRRDRKRTHAYLQRDGWVATTDRQSDGKTTIKNPLRCQSFIPLDCTDDAPDRERWRWLKWFPFCCGYLLEMQIFDRTKLVQRERTFKLEWNTLCRSKQIGSPSCNYLHLPCRRTTISFWTERAVVKQDLQQRQQQSKSGVWHRHRLKDSSISRSWMSCCENRFPPLWFRNDDRERYRNTIDYRQNR